jgi:energy-coupling factor transport system permease protein
MEARAYRGGEGRTRMRRLEMKGRDVLALILVSVVFAVMAWVGRLPLV